MATFVELTPNLTGLADQTEGLAEDDRVSVYIKAILPDRMKIKLTLIHRLEPEPGAGTSFLFYHIRSTLPLGLFPPWAPGTQNTDGLRLAFPLDPVPILFGGLLGFIFPIGVIGLVFQGIGQILLFHIVVGIPMGILVPRPMAQLGRPS